MNARTGAIPSTSPGTTPGYSFTFGVYNQTTPWTDVRTLSWSELAAALTQHDVGSKEGSSIVPAIFSGGRRTKHEARRIDVVLLDSDAGISMDEISGAIQACGWAAVISSTYSHMSTRTVAKRSNWRKFVSSAGAVFANPDIAAAAFLREEKRYLLHVAHGARVAEQTDDLVVFEHQPCPKFRVAIPLLQPWRASSYSDQGYANAAWKERIAALAAALHLDHDQACTDTSRLFYLPRRPLDGPAPETGVLEGEPCDIFALPAVCESDLLGVGAARREKSGKGLHRESDKREYVDPESGQVFDLTVWAGGQGRQFQIVEALRARRPCTFVGKIAERTKHHIRCVNEAEHTQAGADIATFVVNASESLNKGFVYHCRHAHCDGRDRLFFVCKMLEEGWLTPADLTDERFQSSPGAGQSDQGDGSPSDGQPLSLQIGSDTEIADRVAADLQERFGQVVFSRQFWFFRDTQWEAIPDHTLWLAASRYDGALFYTIGGKLSRVTLNKTRIESILTCMRPSLTREDFFDSPSVGINCASGFIRFDDHGKPNLEKHSPDHRHRHTLAGRWPKDITDEQRRSSLLEQLLEGCFRDDDDKQAKVDLLAEVGGIAALGLATKMIKPKALVLKGELAENGKSQVLDVLRSLLPKSAVASISPARFDDRTFTCHLDGKLLNAPDELASGDAIASEMFKQIITGEPLTVRDLYKSAFEFRPVAQHVYATNNLPSFKGGMDRGVRRRLMVLSFNRVIPVDERIDHIGLKIGSDEADLLLDWAVRGASRVIARQAFTEPPSSTDGLRDWMLSSDPVLGWLGSGAVRFARDGRTPEVRTKIAYNYFRQWAIDEGYPQDKLPAVNGSSQRVVAAAAEKGVTKKRTSEGAMFIGLECFGIDTPYYDTYRR